MGTIVTTDGRNVETEDIDLLVRFKPLAELDMLVELDRQVLEGMADDDPLKSYWIHRSEAHTLARDIATWCWDNDIPTIDLPIKDRDRTQGLYALEKCRELEGILNDLKGHCLWLQNKIDEQLDKSEKRKQQREAGLYE